MRLTRRTAVPLLLLALGACARPDPRLERLSEGINGDSVTQIMGGVAPTKREAYIVDAKLFDVRYYARPGVTDSVGTPEREMSPVVLVNGQLAVWGWERWDSLAAAYRIQVAPKQ